ncbi:hypothetical protein EV192_106232 [Actinocrispum wychmicini]|uniref:Uncharacterized protein n=1 Tax=Actinocrispum wychmicini TaxID=1213861 RepID=A0A4R2JE18_9PSEU|nr:hypothetical protein EV192_106232 [Actinocrispum wychmicini]
MKESDLRRRSHDFTLCYSVANSAQLNPGYTLCFVDILRCSNVFRSHPEKDNILSIGGPDHRLERANPLH